MADDQPKKPSKKSASANGQKAPERAKSRPPKITQVQMRDEFYHDRAVMLWFIVIFTFVVFFSYLFILYIRFTDRPKPIYFEAQKIVMPAEYDPSKQVTQYRITKPVDIDEAFLTTGALFIWVNSSMSDIFSFNFKNADAHFNSMMDYFTESGWAEFRSALETAGLLEQVKNERLIVTTRAVKPPLLQNSGVYKASGRFEWHVEVEMLVQYQSSETNLRQRWTINVIAVRVPISRRHPRGVALDFFRVANVRSSI